MDEGGGDRLLAGFLFGNINEDGKLENDVFDSEAASHLDQLLGLGGLGGLVNDIAVEGKQDSASYVQDCEIKADNCIDYSNIDELAQEEAPSTSAIDLMGSVLKTQADEDDYDDEDDKGDAKQLLIPQLSVVAKAETRDIEENDDVTHLFSSSPKHEGGDGEKQQSEEEPEVEQEEEQPELRGLAALEGKTVTDLYPDFHPNKVLRFSRLFGPKKYVSAQWKGLKKKRRKRKLLSVDSTKKTNGFELRLGPPPKPEDLQVDEMVLHTQPIPLWAYGEQYLKNLKISNEPGSLVNPGEDRSAEWLNGPAAYWYEKHSDLIVNGKFNYGFKLKDEKAEEKKKEKTVELPPDDQFNMVALQSWEEDVIWSSDDYVPSRHSKPRQMKAGWIASGNIRTMQAYLQQNEADDNASMESVIYSNILRNFDRPIEPELNKDARSRKLTNWYSIFPNENKELVYGNWEDKIIWDSEAMEHIPSPEIFRPDPNDENILLKLPEDSEHPPETEAPTDAQLKKDQTKAKTAKTNKRNTSEQEGALIQITNKNRYNLSNDAHYLPKQDLSENQIQADVGNLCIQHSTPAVELRRPFFPTFFPPNELRTLHRPKLTKKKLGMKSGFHVIHSLYKRIKRKAKEREKERQTFGGGEMFFMRTPEDLSAMDGNVVLMEYCEEMPPLLSQAGMNSRIKNYFNRKHGKEPTQKFDYGEITYIHHSPFLGQLNPGQVLQALENNLFRAPVFQHRLYSTDFLMLKIHQGYYVRNLGDIFTVGQLCPKLEVPGPNSKRANNHIRDFLQIFIYRLFWKSPDTPRRIKMEDIRKAFPKHSESSVRKRLKLCADFRRTGADCNWWVLKNDFRLPSEEEMRAIVTPEQTCAYYVMLAAEQRLKDAGYGEKSLFAPDDEDNENDAKKIDDEIQIAPWNTTRAYIQAVRGKCLLQVSGVADPTGCGEGFSYIRIPNKPVSKDETEEQKQAKKQKLVTGTDADLRRLNLKQARILLKEFNVPQEEIQKLSRWEVIDKVRTMSTEAAKTGTTEVAMNKFARGSRFTVAEHQERYKDECQRIFDLQNKVLQSDANLSTEEESSGEEGSDMEDLGKDLESMLSNKKLSSEEHEEAERKELQKLLNEDKVDKPATQPPEKNSNFQEKQEDPANFEAHAGRRLLIHRTFREGGREFVRTETVKSQFVIDSYLRIVTREKNYREVFASQDEKHKEDMRRERRRIQEQLRRIKRNEERERLRQLQQQMEEGVANVQPSAEDLAKLDALTDRPNKTLKCGACGGYGHMKTNKMCPKYTEIPGAGGGISDDDDGGHSAGEEGGMARIAQDDLIKVEGTKITLGKAFIEAQQDMRRKALTIRIPKENVIPHPPPPPPPPKKKRKPPSATQNNTDYLKRHHKSKNRRRTNPVVALGVILETISTKLKEIPESWPFYTPVSSKIVPDYYKVVKKPMDLQTIRENIKNNQYRTADSFIQHVSYIHSNCILYNGLHHPLTKVAENMVELANKDIKANEKEIAEIEREINPLLDDDPQVGFSWICETILSLLKALPESWPFHQPVPVKVVPDYYDVIEKPIDMDTIKQRCQEHHYRNRGGFLEDIDLLYSNSLTYNGMEHAFTKTAQKLIKKCKELIDQREQKMSQLEELILQQPEDYIPPNLTSRDHSFADFNFNTFQSKTLDKQLAVVVAGDEDEYVDIEGEELTYNDSQIFPDTSNFENYQGFEGGELEGELETKPDEQMDLGLLLLQDLVHSDEEESDDDIPLDDGDEDIPLDDGDEFEHENEGDNFDQGENEGDNLEDNQDRNEEFNENPDESMEEGNPFSGEDADASFDQSEDGMKNDYETDWMT